MAAAYTLYSGAAKAGLYRQKGSKIVAAQRVGFAAAGGDVSKGSALEIQQETSYLSELDAQNIALDAAMTAWGYRKQGASFSAQAAADRIAGNNRAAGTILGGQGQIAAGVGNLIEKIDRYYGPGAKS